VVAARWLFMAGLGAGPTVVGGVVVFVNSGYGFLGGAEGNVLLAFSVDGW